MIIRTLILRPTDDSFRTERTVTLSTVDPSLSNNTPDPKTSNILIGRGKTLSDCLATTLLFHTRVVSRHHGLLLLRPDAKIYLQDTGSSSGTFLNGSRLSPAGVKSRPFELVDGDRIQLGEDIVLDGHHHKTIRMTVHFDAPIQSPQKVTASPLLETPLLSPEQDPLDDLIEKELNEIWLNEIQTSTIPFIRLRSLVQQFSLEPKLSSISVDKDGQHKIPKGLPRLPSKLSRNGSSISDSQPKPPAQPLPLPQP